MTGATWKDGLLVIAVFLLGNAAIIVGLELALGPEHSITWNILGGGLFGWFFGGWALDRLNL